MRAIRWTAAPLAAVGLFLATGAVACDTTTSSVCGGHDACGGGQCCRNGACLPCGEDVGSGDAVVGADVSWPFETGDGVVGGDLGEPADVEADASTSGDLPDAVQVDACTPDCDGRECGDDGCGGTCGECGGACCDVDDVCEEASGQCSWSGRTCTLGDAAVPVECPVLPGYSTTCNSQEHCEYRNAQAVDCDSGSPAGRDWRCWDVWIWVPPGSFTMGDVHGLGEDDSRPAHPVTIGQGFFLSRYEIVVAPYEECERLERCEGEDAGLAADWDGEEWGLNRAANGRGDHPQNGLSKEQAGAFCEWFVEQGGGQAGRLPTEAEWEYAATGSEQREFPWRADLAPSCDVAVHNQDGALGRPWGCDQCIDEGCSGTQPVGSRPQGASYVGADDMAGNMWEWVEDCWHGSYAGAPADGRAWTEDCDVVHPEHTYNVRRGGGFADFAFSLRTAYRHSSIVTGRYGYLGGRCVRPAP